MKKRQSETSKPDGESSGPDATSPVPKATVQQVLREAGALDRAGEGPQTDAKREALRAQARAMGLSLISLTVTEGHVPDPVMDALSPQILRQIAAVTESMYTRPASQVKKLRALIAKHPQVPVLRNHLAVALACAGDDGEAERVIAACAAEFPDYVFGVCNFVLMLVQQGRLEEARAVIEDGPKGPRMVLSSFDAGRDTYHISEALTHASAVGHYLLATGRPEEATRQLELLARIGPDSGQCLSLLAALAKKAATIVTRKRPARPRGGVGFNCAPGPKAADDGHPTEW